MVQGQWRGSWQYLTNLCMCLSFNPGLYSAYKPLILQYKNTYTQALFTATLSVNYLRLEATKMSKQKPQ